MIKELNKIKQVIAGGFCRTGSENGLIVFSATHYFSPEYIISIIYLSGIKP